MQIFCWSQLCLISSIVCVWLFITHYKSSLNLWLLFSSDMVFPHHHSTHPSEIDVDLFLLKAVIVAGSYAVTFQDHTTLPKGNTFSKSCYCSWLVCSDLSRPHHPPKAEIFLLKAVIVHCSYASGLLS